MKRLYVSPERRGRGVGRGLVDALIKVAEGIGFDQMRLDILPSMTGAQSLYFRLGFEVIASYHDTPVAGTLFMRHLRRSG